MATLLPCYVVESNNRPRELLEIQDRTDYRNRRKNDAQPRAASEQMSKGRQNMRSLMEVSLVAFILTCGAAAQDSQRIPLKQGVSVQMAVASHAAEMRAADDPNAQVVAITADGKVYLGVKVTDPGTLSSLSEGTVYVKSDARAPYQKVLAVLDALHGKSVVLLTAPPENAVRQGMVSPYGVTLIVPM